MPVNCLDCGWPLTESEKEGEESFCEDCRKRPNTIVWEEEI